MNNYSEYQQIVDNYTENKKRKFNIFRSNNIIIIDEKRNGVVFFRTFYLMLPTVIITFLFAAVAEKSIFDYSLIYVVLFYVCLLLLLFFFSVSSFNRYIIDIARKQIAHVKFRNVKAKYKISDIVGFEAVRKNKPEPIITNGVQIIDTDSDFTIFFIKNKQISIVEFKDHQDNYNFFIFFDSIYKKMTNTESNMEFQKIER